MHFYFGAFVLVCAPALVFSSTSDILDLVTRDPTIWKCVTSLDEECVDQLAKKPVEQLLKARELRIGSFLSVEKVGNVSNEGRGLIENVWDVNELMNAGLEYMSSHALKLRFGNIEARMAKSKSKPDSLEFSVEARRRGGTGKSQKLYRVIIPLVIGFKITGLVIFGIVMVKLFLMKAALVANSALLVAGGIVMKKLYDHGMGLLNHHHSFLNSHMSLPNYYSNNHDFSGYGYNHFGGGGSNGLGNSFESASSLHSEVADPLSSEVGDLHGGFSNHAIAMAALNKTLMQQQGHQQIPKRRWSNKWSPWQTNL